MLNGENKQLKLIQEYYAIYHIKSLYYVFEDFTQCIVVGVKYSQFSWTTD